MPPEVSSPARFAFSYAGREAARLSEEQRNPSQGWGTSSCLYPRSSAWPSCFPSLCLSFPMHRGVTLGWKGGWLSQCCRTPGNKLHTKEQNHSSEELQLRNWDMFTGAQSSGPSDRAGITPGSHPGDLCRFLALIKSCFWHRNRTHRGKKNQQDYWEAS